MFNVSCNKTQNKVNQYELSILIYFSNLFPQKNCSRNLGTRSIYSSIEPLLFNKESIPFLNDSTFGSTSFTQQSNTSFSLRLNLSLAVVIIFVVLPLFPDFHVIESSKKLIFIKISINI